MEKLGAPRCGVAGHEEGGEGFVLGCREGRAAWCEVVGLKVLAEEGEDREDTALVIESCVAADHNINSDEEGEEEFMVYYCGGFGDRCGRKRWWMCCYGCSGVKEGPDRGRGEDMENGEKWIYEADFFVGY